jgi:hypothetical protein
MKTTTTAVEFERAVESPPDVMASGVRWAGRTLIEVPLELRVPRKIDLVHSCRA